MSKIDDPLILSNHWKKLGRGRSFQFFVTDDEILTILLANLPQEFAPYFLVGIDTQRGRDGYTRTPFSSRIIDLPILVKTKRGNNIYWIGSKPLTPNLDFTINNLGNDFALNGLIELHHGKMREVKRVPHQTLLVQDASSLGMVDRIHNALTGERISYEDYFKIFSTLKRALRKILSYTSIAQSAGDKTSEVNFQHMSEGAAQLSKEGYPFLNTVGHRIKPR